MDYGWRLESGMSNLRESHIGTTLDTKDLVSTTDASNVAFRRDRARNIIVIHYS